MPQIMRNVVYALLPVCAFSIWQFGLSALLLIVTVVISCLLTERYFNWLSGRTSTLGDWSATITGILMALTLPPGFPLWMGVVAAVSGIAIGKAMFGGMGFNVFNPALVGRAFVQAAFPVAITTWTPAGLPGRFVELIPTTLTLPFTTPPAINDWLATRAPDSFTGATPLGGWKFGGLESSTLDLFTGMTAGSAGETSAILILLCGGYLIYRRMMDWRIPLAMIGTTFLLSAIFYLVDDSRFPDPLFMILSGGLMLGAMFMASDMVASPVTPAGVWIYGALMGVLTVVIRLFGALPEGVMYAILFGNAASPLIENLTQPRIYGSRAKEEKPS